ncbi:hypothetical protein Bbelb_349260 [Branchiostoma belcheri]|nr:hypothetical protein Bbelb_349260 [Branchiostoma belcheri]
MDSECGVVLDPCKVTVNPNIRPPVSCIWVASVFERAPPAPVFLTALLCEMTSAAPNLWTCAEDCDDSTGWAAAEAGRDNKHVFLPMERQHKDSKYQHGGILQQYINVLNSSQAPLLHAPSKRQSAGVSYNVFPASHDAVSAAPCTPALRDLPFQHQGHRPPAEVHTSQTVLICLWEALYSSV